jgi:hypothetical protein
MVTFSLGKAYLQTNQKVEAILSFNHALELDPLFDTVPEDEIRSLKNSPVKVLQRESRA